MEKRKGEYMPKLKTGKKVKHFPYNEEGIKAYKEAKKKKMGKKKK